MPGHIVPIEPLVMADLEPRLVPAIAKWQDIVVESAAFLAPKLTGDLAATVVADEPQVTSANVTGRVRTQRYYARWQETKESYKHKQGQAHYMADSVLLSIQQGYDLVVAAVKG